MKKVYEKPFVEMESFQLDAAIAASCSSQHFVPIGHSAMTCSYDVYFSDTNCDFDAAWPEEDGNDSDCYHGPQGVTFTYS